MTSVDTFRAGEVIFTSRHADSARLRQCIAIPTMSEDESLNLLLQRAPLSKEERYMVEKYFQLQAVSLSLLLKLGLISLHATCN